MYFFFQEKDKHEVPPPESETKQPEVEAPQSVTEAESQQQPEVEVIAEPENHDDEKNTDESSWHKEKIDLHKIEL